MNCKYKFDTPSGVERQVVAYFIKTARDFGFTPVRVWNGEENLVSNNDTELMNFIFSAKRNIIYFSRPKDGSHYVQIEHGLEGGDCITEYSDGEDWDAVIQDIKSNF